MKETDITSLPATQKNILRLAQKGLLNAPAYERALKIIGFTPDARKWNRFLSILLLVLGAGLTVSGVYFFFAYNWASMNRFVKLGIAEAVILGLIVAAYMISLEKLTGKIILTVAGLLIGALLAVYGQVYQTGADSYTLFLYWTLFMAGWVFISRFTPMWLAWILLINITLSLYWDQMLSADSEEQLYFWMFLINGIFLLLWEFFSRKVDWLVSRWTPRILSLPVFYSITFTAGVLVTGGFGYYWTPDTFFIILGLLFLPVNAAVLYVYSQRHLDLFMLTISAMSLMIVFNIWFAQLIEEADDFVPLILGMLIIGQTALAVTLLLRTSRSWEARKQ